MTMKRLGSLYLKSELTYDDTQWLYQLIEKGAQNPQNEENRNFAVLAFGVIRYFVEKGSLYNDTYTFRVISMMMKIFDPPPPPGYYEVATFLREYPGQAAAELYREICYKQIRAQWEFNPDSLSVYDVKQIYDKYKDNNPSSYEFYKGYNIRREPIYIIPVLRSFLNDTNQLVRYRAAVTLAYFRDTLAIPTLEEIILKYLPLSDSVTALRSGIETSNYSTKKKLEEILFKVEERERIYLDLFGEANLRLFYNGDPPSIPFLVKLARTTKDTTLRARIFKKMVQWKLPVRGIYLNSPDDLIGFVVRYQGRNISVIYEDKIEQWNKW